jgi:hypothetical protein
LFSLSISITAAAVLSVDAESTINAVASVRRRNMEYFCYLPLKGGRRAVLLASLTVFMAGYLVLAASSIAVALHLFPLWVVVMVLVADCGVHHLMRAADGEWWIAGDAVRTGMGLRLADTVGNTGAWVVFHACPLLCIRDANWVGPHGMARIVVCALLEGAFVFVAALALPTDDSTPAAHDVNVSLASQTVARVEVSRIMAWRICLPSLCVALMALATFCAAMEPRYRGTFIVRDSRLAMHRRQWAAWAEGTHGDEDRALSVGDGHAKVGSSSLLHAGRILHLRGALRNGGRLCSSMRTSCQAMALNGFLSR